MRHVNTFKTRFTETSFKYNYFNNVVLEVVAATGKIGLLGCITMKGMLHNALQAQHASALFFV